MNNYHVHNLAKKFIGPILDILLSPLTFINSCWIRLIRDLELKTMNLSLKIFNFVGVFPIKDHYYEPLFNSKYLKFPLVKERDMPWIDLNIDGQIKLLEQLNFETELLEFPFDKKDEESFYFNNRRFCTGDVEILYNMIRFYKPKNLIEIGSGFSSRIASSALQKNKELDPTNNSAHLCIEPCPSTILRKNKFVEIIEQRVEELDLKIFNSLNSGDFLFIKSTHIIKPQGDILTEYLEILPQLKPGVVIHIHDIFTPRNYPEEWIKKLVVFWNQQYLVESILFNSKDFTILCALNFLFYNFRTKLERVCPFLARNFVKKPRSLWIQKN